MSSEAFIKSSINVNGLMKMQKEIENRFTKMEIKIEILSDQHKVILGRKEHA